MECKGEISGFDYNSEHGCVALITLEKELQVWKIPEMKLIYSRSTPRRSNKITILKDGKTVLIGDKSGNVYRYAERYVFVGHSRLLLMHSFKDVAQTLLLQIKHNCY